MSIVVRIGCAVLLVVGWTGPVARAAPSDGYVRLAHLSPDTPAVDVYLYAGRSTDRRRQRLVLKHVGYGALSPYQRLGGGTYTVAMRPANAAAASPPVLTTNVRVRGGKAYTVAGMGPYKSIRLRVLDDSVELPEGRAALRVIAASLKEPSVDAGVGGRRLASGVRFASATPYEVMAAGEARVRVRGRNGQAVTKVSMVAGSAHTVVVLDGKSGLRLLSLRDSVRGARTPRGGVDAGLGGMAKDGAWGPGVLGLAVSFGVLGAVVAVWRVGARRRA